MSLNKPNNRKLFNLSLSLLKSGFFCSLGIIGILFFKYEIFKQRAQAHLSNSPSDFPTLRHNKKAGLILQEIAADGVITDQELLEYGVKTELLTIVDEKHFAALKENCWQSLHYYVASDDIVCFKESESNPDQEKSYFALTLPQDKPVLLKDILNQIKNDDKSLITIKCGPHYSFTTTCDKLQNTATYFAESEQILGLKNIPLYISNSDEPSRTLSFLYGEATIYLEARNIDCIPEMTFLVKDHELGHVKSSTEVNGFKSYTSIILKSLKEAKIADHIEENKADSFVAVLNSNAPKTVFYNYIGHGTCTQSGFFNHLKRFNENRDLSDPHAPSVEMVKRIMLVSAKTFTHD